MSEPMPGVERSSTSLDDFLSKVVDDCVNARWSEPAPAADALAAALADRDRWRRRCAAAEESLRLAMDEGIRAW